MIRGRGQEAGGRGQEAGYKPGPVGESTDALLDSFSSLLSCSRTFSLHYSGVQFSEIQKKCWNDLTARTLVFSSNR
ncbi:hypothetical protein GXM_02254 [Nostoc sphaeroides CCNUC1]|uniref:Uncharacterized protein n=1 Tax=Nostoc sphaeroides CCNUC1 TaxID=2653204 RepID=A0A5P8VY81_9NOSO|nr:hypothetical protein GXM_02254 [Nostoc sphaeroides CCNUC1]